jgi:DNA-binding GntR family transcriptional regulator
LAGAKSNNHLALRDVAFEKIRTLIVSGSIAPGERLIEESLGQRLGMSRNPVRESLKLLEREGFVTIHSYRGAVVSQIGRKDAMDIFEIRELLDTFAAERAAKQATEADLAELRDTLRRGARALEKGKLAQLGLENTRFHAKVHDMSGNFELSETLKRLRLKVEWMFAGYAASRGGAAWVEHQLLVDAIAAGNPKLAGNHSRDHVARSRLAYLDLLSASEGADGLHQPVVAVVSR